MNTTPLLRLFSLLAAGLVPLAACRTSSPEPAADDRAPVRASTAVVRRAALPATFEAGGIVRGRATALVASQVMAPVTLVHVRPGDHVRQGAALVTLDAREIAANRSRATATLTSSSENVAAAEGAVRAAEAALTLARTTRDRMQTLHDKRSATTQERDQAVAAYEAAEGQVQSARANLAAASAARQAAAAGSDAATAVLSYTTLTAPFAGVVTERRVDPGDMAAPGMPLIAIEDTTGLRLDVTVDDTRAGSITAGLAAEVAIGDHGDWQKATVREIARVSPDSHAVLVKLDLPGGMATRSGAFARARFAAAERTTLLLPATSVIRRGQLSFVFVVDGENRARLQPVSPGAIAGDAVEALAGVADGARVVVNPPPALSEGVRIDEAHR